MDAVEFIKERDRMCNTYGNCALCPACLDNECIVARRSSFAPEQQINTVTVWAEQHPRKTRQSVFLEQYPEAEIDLNGLLVLCPKRISAEYRDTHKFDGCINRLCSDCRCEFWAQEVE